MLVVGVLSPSLSTLFSLARLADGVREWENVNSLLLRAAGRNVAAPPPAGVAGGAGSSRMEGGVAVARDSAGALAAGLVLRGEVRRGAVDDTAAARATLLRVLDDTAPAAAAAAARAALLRVLGRDPAWQVVYKRS